MTASWISQAEVLPDLNLNDHDTGCLNRFVEMVRMASENFNLMSTNQRPPLVDDPLYRLWWSRHILDSCAPILKGLQFPGNGWIDIGSGAGFPAIPLKILQPVQQLTMVESVGKKNRFLSQTARQLNLAGCVVEAGRVEALTMAKRRAWDLVTARAVGPPQQVIAWAMRVLRPGGLVWIWLSAQQAQQFTNKSVRGACPQAQLVELVGYRLPEISAVWALGLVRKIA